MAGGSGAALAEAALALVGAPFRLYGRDPATGLDCIGVFACALRATGSTSRVPGDYRMRMRDLSALSRWAQAHEFAPTCGEFQAGDVVVFAVGPEQAHLAIAQDGGEFVHAHAGLRRVVRSGVPSDWRIIGHWRPPEGKPREATEE